MWKLSINLAPTLSLVSCNYCINKLIMPMSLSVTHFDVAALIFEAKITGWVRSASSAWLCFNSRAQLAVLQKSRWIGAKMTDMKKEPKKMHFFECCVKYMIRAYCSTLQLGEKKSLQSDVALISNPLCIWWKITLLQYYFRHFCGNNNLSRKLSVNDPSTWNMSILTFFSPQD